MARTIRLAMTVAVAVDAVARAATSGGAGKGASSVATVASAGLAATPTGKAVLSYAMQMMVRLLEPFAPHLGAELWERMGGTDLWDAPWPKADERFLQADTIELAVQVNGKVRARVDVPADISEEEAREAALAHENVGRFLEGKRVVKQVYVPGKLLNIVVR